MNLRDLIFTIFLSLCSCATSKIANNNWLFSSFDSEVLRHSADDVCFNQLEYFYKSIDRHLPWALEMRDSWGNFPSGMLSGNSFDFGKPEQCKNVDISTKVGDITGQHCTLMIELEGNKSKFAFNLIQKVVSSNL